LSGTCASSVSWSVVSDRRPRGARGDDDAAAVTSD
jgi:hypothetical protein